ncbi:MAG: BatD family protein [Parachlamydiaceae bacterium]
MKKNVILSIFTLFFTISVAYAQNISVSLSQKKVSLNESFTLIFSTHQSVKGQPDFSPLEADFDILSNHQEFNTSIINGAVSQVTRWKLGLMAKQEGTLVIPSIHFGSEVSPQALIEVSQASSAKQDETIFLETEVQPADSAYEQTVLVYNVRLYTSIPIPQATLSDLKVSDPEAIVEKLGGDKEYEYYAGNGKRYMVIERRYTVIPQRSGELVFSPIIFEGRILTGRHSFFDYQTQIKRIASEGKKMMIQPIPPPFQRGNWLGAQDVQLSEEWSANPGKMIVGEPITWTFKIEADGTLGSQIPDITLNLPEGVKQYVDKPEVSTKESENGMIGTKQLKIALIGTKEGHLELPEIRLKWWNVRLNQPQETVLPKRTLHIEPDLISMAPDVGEKVKPLTDSGEKNLDTVSPDASKTLPLWVWVLVGANGLVCLGLCVYFFYRRIRVKRGKPDSIGKIKECLKTACRDNHAKAAAAYLIEWAVHTFPEIKPLNIVSIKTLVPEEMGEELDNLNRALYGGSHSSWNGEVLWQMIQNYKPQKSGKKDKKEDLKLLQELYPRGN